MLFRASPCGCEQEVGMTRSKEPHYCEHKNLLVYTKQLGTRADPATRTRSSLKRGKGFAVTVEQRKAVRGKPCVVCGLMSGLNADGSVSEAVDPAHLYPRSLCPCEHAEGVVPLCRAHHRIYDDASKRHQLDLLPKLIDRGYFAELAHPIAAHQIGPVTVIEHVTGERLSFSRPHQTREAAHTGSQKASES